MTTIKTFLFALMLFAVSGIASATTRYLPSSSSDQTAAFQSLIDQSVTGDVVVVQSGNHYLSGTVTVNKNGITVKGDNGNAILKSGSVSCIDVRCSNSAFDNLYIDGANKPEPCMRVYGNYNNITNSTFRNSGNSGLLIDNCNHNTIQGCKAYYNYMVGISQWAHSDGTVRDCQMYENGAEGITIDGGTHNNKVFNNWIHKNNLPHRGVGGIGIDASNGAQIYNNTIDYNGYDGIKFQNNLCCGCDGARVYNNVNISFNEQCAVKFRLTQPVTNFGWWGNTCTNNPGGERCTTDLKSAKIPLEIIQTPEVKVFPNPTKDKVTVSDIDLYNMLKIYNASGKEISSIHLSQSTCEIDLSKFTKGVYLLTFSNSNGNSVTKRVVKQ